MTQTIDQIIQTLKIKLSTEEKLSEIFDYFMTNLAENVSFMDLGELTEHPLLETVIHGVASTLLQTEEIEIDDILIILLEKQQFIHGPASINDNITTFFYFDEIDAGMIAIHDWEEEITKIARFSCQRLGKSPTPETN